MQAGWLAASCSSMQPSAAALRQHAWPPAGGLLAPRSDQQARLVPRVLPAQQPAQHILCILRFGEGKDRQSDAPPAHSRARPTARHSHRLHAPPAPHRSELATIIKEKKAQLPKPDADGNRPSSPLDAEISALEAVSAQGRSLCGFCCELLLGCCSRHTLLCRLCRDAGAQAHARSLLPSPSLVHPCTRTPQPPPSLNLNTHPRSTPPWQERKELIGKKLNEQHNNWGSLLLGLGVTISIAGAYNTFLRTGEPPWPNPALATPSSHHYEAECLCHPHHTRCTRQEACTATLGS